MANMLSPYRRQVSLALKIETIKKLDKRALMDGSSRNAVAEYYLSSALELVDLTDEEIAEVNAEIETNKKKRRGR